MLSKEYPFRLSGTKIRAHEVCGLAYSVLGIVFDTREACGLGYSVLGIVFDTRESGGTFVGFDGMRRRCRLDVIRATPLVGCCRIDYFVLSIPIKHHKCASYFILSPPLSARYEFSYPE